MKTLIAHPHFDYLADQLQSRNPSTFSRSSVQIDKTRSQWPSIIIADPKLIQGADVTFLGDYSRPDEFFEQYALVQSLRDRYARKVRVICPFFPVGTMERISKKGEVATARYFADLIGHFSPTQSFVKFHSLEQLDIGSIGLAEGSSTLIVHPGKEDFASSLRSQVPDMRDADTVIDTFDDGWPRLFINDEKESIEHKDVVYIADLSDPKNLFREYAIMRSIIDYYADSLKVIVPEFPDFSGIDTGDVDIGRYLIDILSHLPSGRKKATEVYIQNPNGIILPAKSPINMTTPFGGLEEKPSMHTFDIHALVERFITDPHQVNFELHTALSLLLLDSDATIAFPDDGAAKRFGESFPEHKDRIICLKVRGEGGVRKITIKEGNPEGKNIIIVDDLIQTGGTLREAADELRARGARSVSAFAPHGVFPHDSHIELARYLDRLIVTDSIPANIERAKSVANMEVLPIISLIEKILRVK